MLTILVDSPDRVKRRMKETHSNGDKEEVYNVAGILWELPPSTFRFLLDYLLEKLQIIHWTNSLFNKKNYGVSIDDFKHFNGVISY